MSPLGQKLTWTGCLLLTQSGHSSKRLTKQPPRRDGYNPGVPHLRESCPGRRATKSDLNDKNGTNFSWAEVNRRLQLPERPLAFGRCQSVELLGTGQATGRDIDGTASKTPPLSRNRPGWQSVRWVPRWFPAGTPLPPSGVRSHSGAWTGRRAW